LGGADQQSPTGGHRNEDDPHREEHPQHDHLQGHLRRARAKYLPRSGEDPQRGDRLPQLHAVRFAAPRQPLRRPHLPVYRGEEHLLAGGARGFHVQDRRGPAFLLHAAGHLGGGRGFDDRQRLLQAGVQGAADGIRGGGAEAAQREPGRERGLMSLLQIKNLHARVGGKEILRGVDLSVDAGEVHAIMGPNGSGKSTLAQVVAGRETYEVTDGQVLYEGKDLLSMPPEERAVAGIFLAFQYPVEIPGVGNLYFLRTALNALRRRRGLEELDAMDFLSLAKERMKRVELDQSFMNRSVNEGFSGG